MRLLHISDLHFGAHNDALAQNLIYRAAQLNPDVIVCTGDLADEPKPTLLQKAYEYLEMLQASVYRTEPPKLLVVPGNHDYRNHGFLWRSAQSSYIHVFGDDETDHYFEPENVWIFGFDSAHDGTAGGGGRIQEQDLTRFHRRYEILQRQTARFKDAVKIIVVHHHPLPVNWDHKWQDRWLTMTNAGAFLSAALFRRIDVVLHGHEHVQARARLRSTLGANDHELTVVSLGSTLCQVSNPDRNWFGLLTVQEHAVHMDFYGSVGTVFSDVPEPPPFVIRSRSDADDISFDHWKQQLGYSYRDLTSITDLTPDGDARKTVQCEGLRVLSDDSQRARAHPVHLSSGSGYLTGLQAHGENINVVVGQIPAATRLNLFDTLLHFGQPLTTNRSAEYSYYWYALNSFAMDKDQFHIMYSDEDKIDHIEFAHWPVSDPIERLTVIVRFPAGFRSSKRPRLRVTRVSPNLDARQWEIDREIQSKLEEENALRYYESLRIATVEVSRPQPGVSYGIQWEVPDARSAIIYSGRQKSRALRDYWQQGQISQQQRQELVTVLARIIIAARESIMNKWKGQVEASFMYFDGKRNLVLLCAMMLDVDGIATEQQYVPRIQYGDGIPGRAFKTNDCRWYVAPDVIEESDGPDYHLPLTEERTHNVVLSLPVRPHTLPGHQGDDLRPPEPYGVFSLASSLADCPLALLGLPDAPTTRAMLAEFQEHVNRELFLSLTNMFLGKDGDRRLGVSR